MRKALVAVLMCAAGLAACDKGGQDVIVVPAAADGGGDEGPQQPQVAATDPATAAPGTDAAATAPGDAATPAAPAGDQPVRKAGLWQISSTNERGSQTGTLCVSAATETARRGVFAQLGGGGGRPGGGQGGQGGQGGGQARPGGQGGPDGGPAGERRGQGGGGQGGGGGGQGGGFGGGGGGAACPAAKISKTADGWTSVANCTRPMGDATMKTSTRQTLTGDLATKYVVKGTRTVSGSPREDANGAHPISITGTYKGACPAGMKAGDYKGSDGQVRNVLQGGGGRG